MLVAGGASDDDNDDYNGGVIKYYPFYFVYHPSFDHSIFFININFKNAFDDH